MQLGAVTQQVQQLQLVPEEPVQLPSPGPDVAGAPPSLFLEIQPPILAAAPPPPPTRRASAPPKTRTTMAPVRQSARQAANHSEVPVAHRAALRLVQGLGILGPREKMTPKAAAALINKFKQPLSDEDITAIATLTRLDPVALRIAAGMAGPDAAASAANS